MLFRHLTGHLGETWRSLPPKNTLNSHTCDCCPHALLGFASLHSNSCVFTDLLCMGVLLFLHYHYHLALFCRVFLVSVLLSPSLSSEPQIWEVLTPVEHPSPTPVVLGLLTCTVTRIQCVPPLSPCLGWASLHSRLHPGCPPSHFCPRAAH